MLPGRIISGTDFIASYFSGGNGSEGNPYILADMQDFKDFAAAMVDSEQRKTFGKSSFKLACDLNLSGEAIAPIGSETLPFEASLDGDGHTVKGLKFTGTATPAALFAKISGTVKNLNVEVDINTAGYNVGAIAGHAVKGALIENCHVNGSVFGTGANSNKAYLGGLVGWSEGATIKGCSFTGQVSSTSNHVGGIVGIGSLVVVPLFEGHNDLHPGSGECVKHTSGQFARRLGPHRIHFIVTARSQQQRHTETDKNKKPSHD